VDLNDFTSVEPGGKAGRSQRGALSVDDGVIRDQHGAQSKECGAIYKRNKVPSIELEAIHERCGAISQRRNATETE